MENHFLFQQKTEVISLNIIFYLLLRFQVKCDIFHIFRLRVFFFCYFIFAVLEFRDIYEEFKLSLEEKSKYEEKNVNQTLD